MRNDPHRRKLRWAALPSEFAPAVVPSSMGGATGYRLLGHCNWLQSTSPGQKEPHGSR